MLLLDEVTVDLDVLVRRDLLLYLQMETEQRGAAIVYATHIFDGTFGVQKIQQDPRRSKSIYGCNVYTYIHTSYDCTLEIIICA